MPVNRNALIRYKTIDKCLSNPYRQWTLEDLIDACSDALYEYEGIGKGVSRRTVQADIQMMRSDKLGYNAPIVVYDNKYYKYSEADYSITNMPLSQHDLEKLSEVTEILKQFKGFTQFKELSGMVQKIEDKVYTAKTHKASVIDMETNENLKGLEHLDVIYNAIISKTVLNITYQSFRARTPSDLHYHSYLLKEFRNRWFVVGRKTYSDAIMLLALDRICSIQINKEAEFIENSEFDARSYFKDVVGVTVKNERVREVHLFVDNSNAPYVITKPMHRTQEIIEKRNGGVVIKINVIPNFELEREILGYGESMEVLHPPGLRKRIQEKMYKAIKNYANIKDSN